MDDFMRRPTEVFVSYLAAVTGRDERAMRRLLELGRIAMAMELITVARIIEEYSLLASKEDTIAVIQTLIVDQDLLEVADEWYKNLSDWRRIKLADDAGVDDHDAQPSVPEAPQDAEPHRGSISSQHGNGQMRDPPSSD